MSDLGESGMDAFDGTLSEGHRKELMRQADRKKALSKRLADCVSSDAQIIFEAGCGHGHWLTSYAEKHTDCSCIGIDLIAGRIDKANAKKAKRAISHLNFIKAELNEFLEVLAPSVRFKAVVFLFPDPWPKARHHKKRMIQLPLLEALSQRMAEGGALYFRTDDRGYFEWTEERLAESPFWQINRTRNWLHEEATYFQDLMETYYSLVAEPINSTK
ncbi:MAG: tRNA (guanosine(46)-N7)-methyltransferase TrmB [Puniceicoccaceae bacterium]|nr:tRNA (guanosine(46)-N7)-methyltransferase TrmB [Puniceicoccaceae bacterium]